MAISLKKIVLAVISILLFVAWILQLNTGPYIRKTPFMFLGTWMLWLVTGLAHLKIFKLKAKLALLVCQSGFSFALALVDTLSSDLEYTLRQDASSSFSWSVDRTKWDQSEAQVRRQEKAIYSLLWCVFGLFFILLVSRFFKQFFGAKKEQVDA